MAEGSAAKRRETKRQVTARRRRDEYQGRIDAATTTGGQLGEACQYLRAVADGLPDEDIQEIAKQILDMANERNGT
jgi:hypothetical protein